MTGFIKIYRSIAEWEWYGNAQMVALWVHLLLRANWEKEKQWHGVTIPRGSLVASFRTLAVETGLSEKQVRLCFERLKKGGQIVSERAGKFSVITICNYDIYHPMPAIEGQEKGAEEGVITATSKEDKNKEIKKSTIVDKEIKEHFITPSAVIRLWKELCPRCKQPNRLTEERARKIGSRIEAMGSKAEDTIRELFMRINASDFLCNGSDDDKHKNWRVDIDWVFKNDTNWVKVLEGKYDDIPGLFTAQAEWRMEGKPYWLKDFENHPEEMAKFDHETIKHIRLERPLYWRGNKWEKQ